MRRVCSVSGKNRPNQTSPGTTPSAAFTSPSSSPSSRLVPLMWALVGLVLLVLLVLLVVLVNRSRLRRTTGESLMLKVKPVLPEITLM